MLHVMLGQRTVNLALVTRLGTALSTGPTIMEASDEKVAGAKQRSVWLYRAASPSRQARSGDYRTNAKADDSYNGEKTQRGINPRRG